MKAWKRAAIVACIGAGIIVSPWIATAIQEGQLPSNSNEPVEMRWNESWVFDQTYGTNASFFNTYLATVNIYVSWPGWPDSGIAAGAPRPGMWYQFVHLMATDAQLESWMGHDLYAADGRPYQFIVTDANGETAIMFHDESHGDWVMSYAKFGPEYLVDDGNGVPIEMLSAAIIATHPAYDGVPLWGA